MKTEQQPNYNTLSDSQFDFKPYTPPKQNVNIYLIIAGFVFSILVIYSIINKNEVTETKNSKEVSNQTIENVKSIDEQKFENVKSIDEQKLETTGNNSLDLPNRYSDKEKIFEDIGEQIDTYIKYNDFCIKDLKTNFYWYIAPDRSFSFEEAKNFASNIDERNLSWRIPTFDEIKKLYNSDYSAGEGFFINNEYYPSKIHNVFNSIGSGSWFWVSDRNSNSSKAYAINLHEGIKLNFDSKNPKYPVHLLLISK